MISLSEFDAPQDEGGGLRFSAGDKIPQSDLALRVQNVSVTYSVRAGRGTARQALLHPLRNRKAIRPIEAVRDVSFEIPHGTVLGVVGHNGAGKSTLLRTVAGILTPTKGRIEVHGRVSTLLAIGLGFNSALTGRDNVFLGGLAAGMTREEIDAKFARIAEFADLGEFINYPLATYSAGMISRLGFSVAVHMEPDILIIDEALSAGDAAFKEKAAAKISEVMSSARTVILVSHALRTVEELCNDAILLDHGRLLGHGRPHDIIAAYQEGHTTGAAALEDL